MTIIWKFLWNIHELLRCLVFQTGNNTNKFTLKPLRITVGDPVKY